MMTTTTTIELASSSSAPRGDTARHVLPAIGRSMIAAVFILSGAAKLADPAGSMAYIAMAGLPLPAVAVSLAIVVELVGGLLLVAGYRVRAVAGVLALFSLATAAVFHHNLGDQSQFIHFFKNVAMAGGLLQIAAFGKAAGARRA